MSNELKGSEFTLELEDPANVGVFELIGGLKSKSFTLNGEPVEVTNHGSNGWRELLNGAGLQSMDVSGEGVTQQTATIKRLFEAWRDNQLVKARIKLLLGAEDVIQITGDFKVATIELSGENDKEVPYSTSLMSSGRPDLQIF